MASKNLAGKNIILEAGTHGVAGKKIKDDGKRERKKDINKNQYQIHFQTHKN